MPRPAAGTGSAADVVLCSGVVGVEVVKLLPLQSSSRSHTAEWCAQTAFQECCAICTVHPTCHRMCTWASSGLVVSHWASASDCRPQPLDPPHSRLRPPADY